MAGEEPGSWAELGKPATLYISYDGMLEPLGQSQVVAYLEGLTDAYRIHLISFEKPADLADAARRASMASRLAGAGIRWHPLTYHKTPTVPATLFDIACAVLSGLVVVLRHRVRLVHARSYVAALAGWCLRRLTGARLLFDMRGLWADERVDGGLWPAGGRNWRMTKRVERLLLSGSDHIVTLTHASLPVLAGLGAPAQTPTTVIPTCTDLTRFTPGQRNGNAGFTLGYLGSIGTRYVFEEALECFVELRRQCGDARLLVVNRENPAVIHVLAERAGIPRDAIEVIAADYADVPALLARMDAGVALYRPAVSAVACAPTKLGEYLGCAIPCLGNDIGDMAGILRNGGAPVGVVLEVFTPAARTAAITELLALCNDPALPVRCRAVAEREFSLATGTQRYRTVYADLLS